MGGRKKVIRDTMGRAQRGLFAGRHIVFGNNVSDSKRRTRRCWKPNVQRKSLFSDALGQSVRVRVTTHALRCVEKAGGLDRYLLDTSESRLNSKAASDLRDLIKRALEDAGQGDSKPDATASRT